MLTLTNIHCPHCGVQGQVVMPTAGALIVGPCPECHKLVAIFAGEALPLDDDIMNSGSVQEKHDHLLHVLVHYVEDRVRQCFSKPLPDSFGAEQTPPTPEPEARQSGTDTPISSSDLENFVEKGLHDLDNPDFFKDFLK